MTVERDIVIVGRHRVWIEEPYALMLEAHGHLAGDDLSQMRLLMDRIGDGQGPILIVQNLADAGEFQASARRGIMEDKRTERIDAVISFGANFHMRVFIGMIAKAVRLVSRRVPRTLFAANEAEARTILATERERLHQRAKEK